MLISGQTLRDKCNSDSEAGGPGLYWDRDTDTCAKCLTLKSSIPNDYITSAYKQCGRVGEKENCFCSESQGCVMKGQDKCWTSLPASSQKAGWPLAPLNADYTPNAKYWDRCVECKYPDLQTSDEYGVTCGYNVGGQPNKYLDDSLNLMGRRSRKDDNEMVQLSWCSTLLSTATTKTTGGTTTTTTTSTSTGGTATTTTTSTSTLEPGTDPTLPVQTTQPQTGTTPAQPTANPNPSPGTDSTLPPYKTNVFIEFTADNLIKPRYRGAISVDELIGIAFLFSFLGFCMLGSAFRDGI